MLSIVAVSRLALPHNSFDLRVYRGTVDWWISHGDLNRFTYPPFAALCLLPMSLLPLSAVVLVNVGLILAADRAPHTAAVRAAALARHPDVRAGPHGGSGARDLLLLLEPRSRVAGVGVGLATALKLTPGLFAVLHLTSGSRRDARTSALTFVGVAAVSAVLSPATSWTYSTSILFDTHRVGSFESATNQSLAGVLTRLTNSTHIPGIWLPLAGCISIASLRSARRLFLAGALLPAFTAAGLAAAVLNPISWVHHLCWVAPALLIQFDHSLRHRSRGRLLLRTGSRRAVHLRPA